MQISAASGTLWRGWMAPILQENKQRSSSGDQSQIGQLCCSPCWPLLLHCVGIKDQMYGFFICVLYSIWEDSRGLEETKIWSSNILTWTRKIYKSNLNAASIDTWLQMHFSDLWQYYVYCLCVWGCCGLTVCWLQCVGLLHIVVW